MARPAVMQFCRSRNARRRCTRELGHAGLHRHRTAMWTDAGADAPRCPGSGSPAEPAIPLRSGWPAGRGLCSQCLRFAALEDGRLLEHDATTDDAAEESERQEWFNTHGW